MPSNLGMWHSQSPCLSYFPLCGVLRFVSRISDRVVSSFFGIRTGPENDLRGPVIYFAARFQLASDRAKYLSCSTSFVWSDVESHPETALRTVSRESPSPQTL